ncbi:MAG: hypothetical protein N2044_10295 [Cyclobacteriaceae bacterium]|nr:hypothetical protein [Cyclobacteriaceae bacterium]
MKNPKKIFLWLALIYLLIVLWVCYDFARKTTFPGSRPQLKERLKERFLEKDSVAKDSIFKSIQLYF